MDDPDSIESIIQFVERKRPNQIRTFLNVQELVSELGKIEMELDSELRNIYNTEDELDDNEEMQTIRDYIVLLDNPANHYEESLANYNAARVSRITRGQLNAMNTRRTASVTASAPNRTLGGRKKRKTRKGRRTRHRKKRGMRHYRKSRR